MVTRSRAREGREMSVAPEVVREPEIEMRPEPEIATCEKGLGATWPKWPNGEYASGYSDILVNNETLVPVPFSRVRGPSVTRPKFLGPLPTPKRLYLQRPSVVW